MQRHRHIPVGNSQELASRHFLTFPHDDFGGCTNVLLHRQYNQRRKCKLSDRQFICLLLVLRRMYPVFERIFHEARISLSVEFLCSFDPFFRIRKILICRQAGVNHTRSTFFRSFDQIGKRPAIRIFDKCFLIVVVGENL